MKITEHIEYLLRQGRSPEELLELGFSKQVITKVRRQLRREKAAQQAKVPKSVRASKGLDEASAVSADNTAATQERLASLESNLKALLQRMGALEAQGAKVMSISDLNSRLDGTPSLGLRLWRKDKAPSLGANTAV